MASSRIGVHLLLWTVVSVVSVLGAQECVHRDYGNGGTVCVCNSTYCDAPEPLALFPPRQYYLYTSSKDGLRLNLTKKNFGTKLKTRGITFTVNTNVTYQTIEGFGGAFTDSAGINILSLSETAQEKLIESYFGDTGSRYTLGRVPIGGCDFSIRPYTYNDVAYDTALDNFNLTEEDYVYKIPLIKKARELNNGSLKLVAAAWTAPPWMKSNEDYTGFGFLKEEYYRVWANYHLRFLEAYDDAGLDIWLFSLGNEPIDGAIPLFPFNCMGWTPQAQRTWVIKHLAPVLKQSRFNSTKLLALDDQRFQLPWWLNILFAEEGVKELFAGVAVHWYWDNLAPPVLLNKTHEAYPDLLILSTEACIVPKFWQKKAVNLGSWTNGENYLDNILEDLSHWVSGWMDWNLALDESGGPNWAGNFVDASIIVNSTLDEFYKQPMYYALSHVSRFIPPGSVRVSLTGGAKGLKAAAFLTPEDYIVIVILNKKNVDTAVNLIGAPRGFANFVVPRKSFTTFICRDKKPPAFKLMDDM